MSWLKWWSKDEVKGDQPGFKETDINSEILMFQLDNESDDTVEIIFKPQSKNNFLDIGGNSDVLVITLDSTNSKEFSDIIDENNVNKLKLVVEYMDIISMSNDSTHIYKANFFSGQKESFKIEYSRSDSSESDFLTFTKEVTKFEIVKLNCVFGSLNGDGTKLEIYPAVFDKNMKQSRVETLHSSLTIREIRFTNTLTDSLPTAYGLKNVNVNLIFQGELPSSFYTSHLPLNDKYLFLWWSKLSVRTEEQCEDDDQKRNKFASINGAYSELFELPLIEKGKEEETPISTSITLECLADNSTFYERMYVDYDKVFFVNKVKLPKRFEENLEIEGCEIERDTFTYFDGKTEQPSEITYIEKDYGLLLKMDSPILEVDSQNTNQLNLTFETFEQTGETEYLLSKYLSNSNAIIDITLIDTKDGTRIDENVDYGDNFNFHIFLKELVYVTGNCNIGLLSTSSVNLCIYHNVKGLREKKSISISQKEICTINEVYAVYNQTIPLVNNQIIPLKGSEVFITEEGGKLLKFEDSTTTQCMVDKCYCTNLAPTDENQKRFGEIHVNLVVSGNIPDWIYSWESYSGTETTYGQLPLPYNLTNAYQENYKLLTSNPFHKWLLVSINALPQFGKNKYLGIADDTSEMAENTSSIDLTSINELDLSENKWKNFYVNRVILNESSDTLPFKGYINQKLFDSSVIYANEPTGDVNDIIEGFSVVINEGEEIVEKIVTKMYIKPQYRNHFLDTEEERDSTTLTINLNKENTDKLTNAINEVESNKEVTDETVSKLEIIVSEIELVENEDNKDIIDIAFTSVDKAKILIYEDKSEEKQLFMECKCENIIYRIVNLNIIHGETESINEMKYLVPLNAEDIINEDTQITGIPDKALKTYNFIETLSPKMVIEHFKITNWYCTNIPRIYLMDSTAQFNLVMNGNIPPLVYSSWLPLSDKYIELRINGVHQIRTGSTKIRFSSVNAVPSIHLGIAMGTISGVQYDESELDLSGIDLGEQ